MTDIMKAAIEAGAEALHTLWCPTGAPFSATDPTHQKYCRDSAEAAILAALPHLGGEPEGYLFSVPYSDNRLSGEMYGRVVPSDAVNVRPLYLAQPAPANATADPAAIRNAALEEAVGKLKALCRNLDDLRDDPTARFMAAVYSACIDAIRILKTCGGPNG